MKETYGLRKTSETSETSETSVPDPDDTDVSDISDVFRREYREFSHYVIDSSIAWMASSIETGIYSSASILSSGSAGLPIFPSFHFIDLQ